MATYAAYRHIELDKVGAGKKRNDKNNTSSDSESDEDYVPSGLELRDERNVSEEQTDDSEDVQDESSEAVKRVRRTTSKRRKKRAKITETNEKVAEQTANGGAAASSTSAAAAATANIDDIWNEFKNDCRTVEPKISKNVADGGGNDDGDGANTSVEPQKAKTKTVTEYFEFAGEAVPVQKEVPIDAAAAVPSTTAANACPPAIKAARGRGLTSVLGMIGKKNKLSVLEKSKLDWDSFKQSEGIAQDLQQHNRGKGGYLEKQDFLQRADLRQFEREKAMRDVKRLK